ncbi:MAG TPA: acylglycerol kinase family protein, partial [Saprospiraceae bacterium]|nr:acylglycerol kinase family protein [Saprospiraceae bacterium]
MQKQTIACIINPKSGVRQNKNLQDEILSTLDTDRYHIEFFETKRRGHATELAEKIVSEGYDILLVCGG